MNESIKTRTKSFSLWAQFTNKVKPMQASLKQKEDFI